LTTRRLAAVLADRPAHGGQQSQFGVDGVEVAHARSVDRAAALVHHHFQVGGLLASMDE